MHRALSLKTFSECEEFTAFPIWRMASLRTPTNSYSSGKDRSRVPSRMVIKGAKAEKKKAEKEKAEKH